MSSGRRNYPICNGSDWTLEFWTAKTCKTYVTLCFNSKFRSFHQLSNYSTASILYTPHGHLVAWSISSRHAFTRRRIPGVLCLFCLLLRLVAQVGAEIFSPPYCLDLLIDWMPVYAHRWNTVRTLFSATANPNG